MYIWIDWFKNFKRIQRVFHWNNLVLITMKNPCGNFFHICTITLSIIFQQSIQFHIDKSIEGVTAIKNDKKRKKEDVSTAKGVLKWLQGIRATFEKEGSLHPSTVLSIMKTVAGVSSGRYGYMVPGWKSSPQGKVPKDFSNEELNEDMTSSVARMSAIVLKKRVVGYGKMI